MIEKIMKQYFGNWNLPEMRGQSWQTSDGHDQSLVRKDFRFESPIRKTAQKLILKCFAVYIWNTFQGIYRLELVNCSLVSSQTTKEIA